MTLKSIKSVRSLVHGPNVTNDEDETEASKSKVITLLQGSIVFVVMFVVLFVILRWILSQTGGDEE